MKLIPLILFLLLSTSSFSQSVFNIVKAARNATRPNVICRTITIRTSGLSIANRVIGSSILSSPIRYKPINSRLCIPKTTITYDFKIPIITYPEKLYGPYNLLKLISRNSRTNKLISKEYISIWKQINNSQTYNGAHHVFNKSTISLIYNIEKLSKNGFLLHEIQNNAPALFHSLHGNPIYKDIFHDRKKQFELYQKGGVKLVLDDFFKNVHIISKEENVRFFSKEVIRNTYLEARLWCETFNLKWE